MPDEINNHNKELEEKLSLAEKERDEYLNGWKRAKADLINAKKDWEERLGNLTDFIRGEVAGNLLPLLDALDESKNISGWEEIRKLASDTFKKVGLEEIESLGREFDPEFHEAVGEAEGEAGKVAEVLQKGYKINGRVIRAAKVKVGKSANNE